MPGGTDFTEEDLARAKENEEAVESLDTERKAAIKISEEDKQTVEKTRAEMLKHAEHAGPSELNIQTIDQGFLDYEKRLFEHFGDRINTDEDNNNLAILADAERIQETFEVARNGVIMVTFQSLNSEENDYASSVTVVNPQTASIVPGVQQRYDDIWRLEILLALSLVAYNDVPYTPFDMIQFRKDMRGCADKIERSKVAQVFLDKVNERICEIKHRIPYGLETIVFAALKTWLKYQRNLIRPEKLVNFSNAPSEG